MTGAAVASVTFAAAGAGGAQARSCTATFSETRAPTTLSATGETCANARKVATRVGGLAPSGCIVLTKGRRQRVKFRSPCVRLNYTCRATALKDGQLRVACSRGARRIRFIY